MIVTPYGTRGSLASPGAENMRYGGNTSCVRVSGSDGAELVLDAGTGIRRLGMDLPRGLKRVDVLITHLHMDHILGLGFFGPLYNPAMEVHIWGPASATQTLSARLSRYLSPPLFPVLLSDLPCRLELHHVPCGTFRIGGFAVDADYVCHPGPTVGYRIAADGACMAYLPDHEPALGARNFPGEPEWTSGYSLARGVDLLIHDAQYTAEEYPGKIGWGHSSLEDLLRFAALAGVRHLVPFHHDPARDDAALEAAVSAARDALRPGFAISPAAEGRSFDLSYGRHPGESRRLG